MKPWLSGRDGSAAAQELTNCFSPSWNQVAQNLGCTGQKTSLVCFMSQSGGWEKENPKGSRQDNPNYPQLSPNYSLKLPARAEHQLSLLLGCGSVNLFRTGFMENVLNFLNPQLFQMSSITDRIFPRAFQTLDEACSCLHSN